MAGEAPAASRWQRNGLFANASLSGHYRFEFLPFITHLEDGFPNRFRSKPAPRALSHALALTVRPDQLPASHFFAVRTKRALCVEAIVSLLSTRTE